MIIFSLLANQVSSAFDQLRERIEGFVYDPFLIKLSNKIVTGLKVLIDKSEQVVLFYVFFVLEL